MYELKRTAARAAFKDLLGQANHFLITILIGLNGVRAGQVGQDPEFHAAWNPHNIKASADRSRIFALDLALVRAVDSLDMFMMMSRRAPSTLGSQAFESQMDGARRSVVRRFDVFCNNTLVLSAPLAAFMSLAIAWRNRRVHSLSDDELPAVVRETLIQNAGALTAEFRGLNIQEVLTRFERNESPQFKDAAGVIALTHAVVECFDQHLLLVLDIEHYVQTSLRTSLGASSARGELEQIRHAAHRIWGDKETRKLKAERALRFVGVHRVEKITGRQVPDQLVERILSFEPEDAMNYLGTSRA